MHSEKYIVVDICCCLSIDESSKPNAQLNVSVSGLFSAMQCDTKKVNISEPR